MAQREYDDALQVVLKRLEESRARLIRKCILHGFSWVALVAVVGFALLELLRYLSPVIPWFSFPSTSLAAIVVLGGFALGLMGILVYAWLTAPDLARVAQQADRLFRLDERLSTAVEFRKTERLGTSSPVLHALFRDIGDRAEQVRPEELVALTFPRQAWYLMSALLATFALQLTPPLSSPATAVTSAALAMTLEKRTEIAADVRRVAALVSQDAEQQKDPYLQAVARALEQFGADVEQGNLDSEAITEELSRLVEHLARGYGIDGQAASELAAMLSVERRSGDAATSPAVPEGEQLQGSEDEQGEGGKSTEATRTTLENLFTQVEAGEAEVQQLSDVKLNDGLEQTQAERQSYGYTHIDPEMLARLEREREIRAQLSAENPAGGVPIGDGDGASDEAGAGTASLFDEDGNELPSEWAGAGQEVELPFDQEASRRIRVEMAPEAQFTAIAVGQGLDGNGWRRATERPISPDFLAGINQQVASQYFLSIHSER